jgi:CheY-like chemotaxis protein
MAGNGQEALEIYKMHQEQISLVLTDIMMPGMDGMGLIRALRAGSSKVKIIASSGLGSGLGNSPQDPNRAEELKALGVSAFLPKPYTTDKLLRLIHKILAEERAKGSRDVAAGDPVVAASTV